MALIQALLLGVTRSAGKIVNTAFGWATAMLFGKVPDEKQMYLSAISLGSVLWLAVIAGIIYPPLGTIMLAAAPVPDGVDHNIIRLVMLGLALVIPPAVGFISILMLDEEERPKGKEKAVAIAKGYPYTAGLGLTLLMMLFIAPILKVGVMIRRWESAHLPVIVESPDYSSVLDKMEEALKNDGFDVRRKPASKLMKAPTKFLTMMAGGAIDRMVADNLVVLATDNFEAELHPSDLILRGKKQVLGLAQATLAVALAFSKAYMTWTKEANEVEDQLEDVRWLVEQGGAVELALGKRRLTDIERQIHELRIPYEEWQTLFREKLLVERILLEKQARGQVQQSIPEMVRKVFVEAEDPKVRKKADTLIETAAKLMGRVGLRVPGMVVLAGWKAASLYGSIQNTLARQAEERMHTRNGSS